MRTLITEVIVNTTNPKAGVDTEQLQREQTASPPTSKTLGPVVAPNANHAETQISPSANTVEITQVGLVTVPSSKLSFACVLIPRFGDHHLVGDVSEELVEWMRQICISFGWRLDAIVIRPGYLQWVMSVPLNANPAQFMRIIRQHTSQKIFEDFPRFKRQNMSGQFWAPDNFVSAGDQLQTLESINQFILQTRKNQGLI